MTDLDRRFPIKPFDPALVREAIAPCEVASHQLLSGGKCNSNYLLTLDDGERLVLRLRSRGEGVREAYVMNLVRDEVPVPEEVASGEGWSLYRYIEGDLLQSDVQYVGLAAELLGKIHKHRFDRWGWIQADGSIEPFDFGGGEVEDNRDFHTLMLENAEVQRWLSAERIDALRAILKKSKHLFDQMNAQCCLVHGDFNHANVLVHEGRVCGVLDWEFAHAGTPWMDIANMLRHTPEALYDDVAAGLKRGGMDLPDDWIDRAKLTDLSSHLEFLTSPRSDEFKQTRVALVDALITRMG